MNGRMDGRTACVADDLKQIKNTNTTNGINGAPSNHSATEYEQHNPKEEKESCNRETRDDDGELH
jgi:hypothetical protein